MMTNKNTAPTKCYACDAAATGSAASTHGTRLVPACRRHAHPSAREVLFPTSNELAARVDHDAARAEVTRQMAVCERTVAARFALANAKAAEAEAMALAMAAQRSADQAYTARAAAELELEAAEAEFDALAKAMGAGR